ncbi:hypothetical protein [Isoptericola variabilis]|uniref:Lipoprotein n=1 Tax=Isoptericola variabilis (strain 225) TaxID=743718 RepID=F6FTR1_ISOV2|nr:hypothetical protein [Isoptericola variabilis]AEG44188.1 hypothetical protein Isova_1424 [Isoptericola variabilis 225]TWH28495.1 hypothetical protein L600_000400000940 [Isoptericola variabilis J7]
MFGRNVRRASGAVVLSAGLVLASAAGALAHECFNPNRSAAGNAAAGSHSQAWFTLEVADAVQGDVENGVLTPEQAECVLAAYEETGAPSSFTLKVKGSNGQGGVVASNNPHDAKAGDGRGIDEVFAAYGEEILGSYEACGASPF